MATTADKPQDIITFFHLLLLPFSAMEKLTFSHGETYMKLWYSLVIAIVLTLGGFSAAIADSININTATAKEMEIGLKGIGPKRAAAIEQYRNEYGPFQSVDEILKVPGIGNKILDDNRHNLTVSMVTDRQAETTTKAIR